ncbi:cysteine-rich CWC family protein [Shewanella insulae]|uniref:cysteine-rich CWC family protein n=1 Tax=Shewanella insulae TaxID=2681496 RepID=UPI0027E10D4E|nr:cysteine-rich CWC family protein [Shewanella insulae]
MVLMHPNASLCPLCQQPNDCALAARREGDTCWCHHQEFVPKAKIPQAIAPDSCICQACAEALRKEAEQGMKRLD